MALNLGDVFYNLSARTRDLDRAAIRLLAFSRQVTRGGERAKEFRSNLRNMESAAVLAAGPLSGIGARIRSLGAIMDRSTLILAGWIGGITAAGVGIYRLGAAAVTATKQLESLNARIKLLAQNGEDANRMFKFVVAVSRQTGFELTAVGNAYSRLIAAAKGTALEGRGVEDVFRKIAVAGGHMKLSTEEIAGILRAVEQIMSKGQVQSEELRQQLGDRLPGAFNIAAEAMGVTTQELNNMLENGEVLADEFLPRFADQLLKTFGINVDQRIDGISASMGRMRTNFTLFARAFDTVFGVSNAFQAGIDNVSELLDKMRQNIVGVTKAAGILAGALIGLFAPQIIRGLTFTVLLIGRLAAAVATLNIAMLSSPAGKFLGLLARLGFAAAGAAVGYAAMNEALKDIEGSDILQKLNEQAKDLLSTFSGTGQGSVVQFDEDATKKIRGVLRDLQDLKAEVAAMEQGPAALDKYFRNFEKTQELRRVKDTLIEAGVDLETVNKALERFGELITKKIDLQPQLEAAQQLQDVFTSAFDGIAHVMAQNIVDMKFSLESFADFGKMVLEDLIATFLKLAILNPIKDSLFGTTSPTLGAGSIFGQLFGLGAGIPKAAKGTVIGQRSMVVTGSNVIEAGEKGAEAILPLSTDSSGRLGVSAHLAASGAAGNTFIINLINNGEPMQASAQESRQDDGSVQIDITLDEMTAKNIRKFGSKSNTAVRGLGGRTSLIRRF